MRFLRRGWFWVRFFLGKRKFAYQEVSLAQAKRLHQRGFTIDLDADRGKATIRCGS